MDVTPTERSLFVQFILEDNEKNTKAVNEMLEKSKKNKK